MILYWYVTRTNRQTRAYNQQRNYAAVSQEAIHRSSLHLEAAMDRNASGEKKLCI